MGKLPTVKIKDSNSDGYIVINESDFQEGVHELFEEPKKEASKKPEDTKAKADDSEPFPEGYRYEADGAYGHLFGPDEVVIEGPSNGKYHGRDAALEAAVKHAAAHQEAGKE